MNLINFRDFFVLLLKIDKLTADLVSLCTNVILSIFRRCFNPANSYRYLPADKLLLAEIFYYDFAV